MSSEILAILATIGGVVFLGSATWNFIILCKNDDIMLKHHHTLRDIRRNINVFSAVIMGIVITIAYTST